MTIVMHSMFLLLATPVLAASAYLALLTLLSGRLPSPRRSSRQLRFDVIVPAHDEAEGIANTVANLCKLDWPVDRFRVLVVADNCADATAARARAAGARVLVRHDPQFRGKGYALSFAFDVSRAHGWADAVVVVDADTEVASNLLEAFAARIEGGAKAVQAHYGVLNADASWRTRLMSIALTAFHRIRSRARERLHLSCGIRGNGWCVTQRLLGEVPYRSFSITEDIEYGIELGLAGHRVHYADEAHAAATMVVGEQGARTQRQRWESGRWRLMRVKTPTLLRSVAKYRGARRRICLDLAIDLWVLPLSYVALDVAALLTIAGIAVWWQTSATIWLWVGLACGLSLLLYVLRGWRLSGIGLRGLLDLLRAPLFIVWKLLLLLRPHDPKEWVRTKREPS